MSNRKHYKCPLHGVTCYPVYYRDDKFVRLTDSQHYLLFVCSSATSGFPNGHLLTNREPKFKGPISLNSEGT